MLGTYINSDHSSMFYDLNYSLHKVFQKVIK